MGHRIARWFSAKSVYVNTFPLVSEGGATPAAASSGVEGSSGKQNTELREKRYSCWLALRCLLFAPIGHAPAQGALTNLLTVAALGLSLVLISACTQPVPAPLGPPPFPPAPQNFAPIPPYPALPPPYVAPSPGPRAGPSMRYRAYASRKTYLCKRGQHWVKARYVGKRKVPAHCV